MCAIHFKLASSLKQQQQRFGCTISKRGHIKNRLEKDEKKVNVNKQKVKPKKAA